MGGMSGRSEERRGRNGTKTGTEREDGETGGKKKSFFSIVIRMESLTE